MVLALNIAWFTIQKKKYLVKYFAKKKNEVPKQGIPG